MKKSHRRYHKGRKGCCLFLALFFVLMLASSLYIAAEATCTGDMSCTLHSFAIGATHYDTLTAAVAAVSDDTETTIEMLQDFAIPQKLVIPADRKIILKGNRHTLTRAKDDNGTPNDLYDDIWYEGTLIEVAAGSSLLLVSVTVDGANNWTLDTQAYAEMQEASGAAKASLANGNLPIKPQGGEMMSYADPKTKNSELIPIKTTGAVANAWMFINNGTMTVKNSTVKNHFSFGSAWNNTYKEYVYSGGSGLFYSRTAGASLVLENSVFAHNAAVCGGVVADISGAGIIALLTRGTRIEDNFSGGNGGMFKIYNGASVKMGDASLENDTVFIERNRGFDTNGIITMTFGSNSLFEMHAGVIQENSGLRGLSNGFCVPIYLHNFGSFIMTGGAIKNNTGYSYGGIYAKHSQNTVILTAGEISNNTTVNESYSYQSDLAVSYDRDITVGEQMTINGNIRVNGSLENNGTINGNVQISGISDANAITGEGVITGDLVIKYDATAIAEGGRPVIPETLQVQGSLVYVDSGSQVQASFYYGALGADGKETTILSVAKGTQDAPVPLSCVLPEPQRAGFVFVGWYTDKALTQALDLSTYGVADADVSFYAKWVETTSVFEVNDTLPAVVYTGTAHTPIPTALKNGVPTDELAVVRYENNVNAGTATIVYTLGNDPTERTANFVIKKAVYDMSGVIFRDQAMIENGTYRMIEATNLPEGVFATYEGGGKLPGVYTVTAKFLGDQSNYEAIPDMTAVLTVNNASVPIEFRNGATENDADIKAENGFAPGASLVVTLLKEYGDYGLDKRERIAGGYHVALMKNGVAEHADSPLTVKLLIPEVLRGNTEFTVLNVHDNSATALNFSVDGDYAIVNAGNLSEFVFVYQETSMIWLILLLAGVALLELALILAVLIRRSRTDLKTRAVLSPAFLSLFIPKSQVVTLIVLGAIVLVLGGALIAVLASGKRAVQVAAEAAQLPDTQPEDAVPIKQTAQEPVVITAAPIKPIARTQRDSAQELAKIQAARRDIISAADVGRMLPDHVALMAVIDKRPRRRLPVGKKGIVNVDMLSKAFAAGETVTLQKLKQKNLISPSTGYVKVLARGELDKALKVQLQDYSIEAIKMILIAGGTVFKV